MIFFYEFKNIGGEIDDVDKILILHSIVNKYVIGQDYSIHCCKVQQSQTFLVYI